MLDFKKTINSKTKKTCIETSIRGKPLLTTPQLNKGTAFTVEERHTFGLLGKLPPRVETLEEQVERAYLQYQAIDNKLRQNVYLNNLQNINQVLFYALVGKHLMEMVPTIYTPVVGEAVEKFSKEYRRSRGLYIAYPEQEYIEEMLENRSNPEIDVIVVTDGEAILGIGDQGVGGIDIPIAKLMIYVLIAGIDPNRVLPIQLDVGTDNPALLNDPCYLGWNHKRVRGPDYDHFINRFVQAIKNKFPKVFLHWEDFGRDNAARILGKYRNDLCTFNDDIQGTGAVTLAALLAGCNYKKETLAQQKIVVFGAGTAGMGITKQIYDYLIHHDVEESAAKACFWLVDRQGLLFEDTPNMTDEQKVFARSKAEHQQYSGKSLQDVIELVKPSVLIGCSTQTGAFTETIIKKMAGYNVNPIILPLSNPTELAEAKPEDIIRWTEGKALLATGSPFEAVRYQEADRTIAQCNNALIFPALGLGILISQASCCTPKMVQAAAEALARHAPIMTDKSQPLLPDIEGARQLAKKLAMAVAMQAIKDGVARGIDDSTNLEKLIQDKMWHPQYLPYEYVAKV